MKRQILLILGILATCTAGAQINTTATVSYVLGLGAMDTCKAVTGGHGSGSTSTENDGFYAMQYNYNTNSLSKPNNTIPNNPCYPKFPSYGVTISGHPGPAQIFNSSIAYNPKDQREYYYTYIDTTISGVSTTNTYMYSWPVGTCPTGTVMPIQEFKNSFLLATFDNSGNSWAVNFVSNGSGGYNLFLQEITIAGSVVTLGPDDPVVLPTGTPTITNTNGDVVFTPTGGMFLVVNNEEIAIGYTGYNPTTTTNITGTYVGKVSVPSGNYVVGLAFAGGSLVASVSNGTLSCTPTYVDINIITGGTTAVTFTGAGSPNGAGFNSNDNASVTSGIGSAKSLVSVTATGNPGEVNVVYDIYVQSYGNYPVANVQVVDDLSKINGVANVKNVSTSWVTQPPASYGINLNPSYNGIGVNNDSLLVSGGTLYNYPTATDFFVIQVSATIEGINLGSIYYNAAAALGVGFNGDQLTDTSTNGTHPDLNDNNKPDDIGEDVPTPFLLQITPSSAPCTVLPGILFQETFGPGSGGMSTALPAGGTTQYTGTTTAPVGTNDYTITKNANTGNVPNWNSLTDHTTGTGNMMLVNADVPQSVVYQTKISNLCSGIKYSLNAYVANISDTAAITFCNAVGGYQPPNLTFQIYDSIDEITVANLSTGPIWNHTWASYGMRVPLPSQVTSGTVYLQIINNGGGGCGNDFALDDISFGRCDPQPTVVVDGTHAGCKDSSTVLAVILSDTTVFSGDTVVYVWQDSIPGSGAWTNTLPPNVTQNQNTGLLDINPVSALNANQYYRVNVANSGNSFKSCSYYSPAFLISLKASSLPPTSVSANPGTTEGCTPTPITLTEVGGFLGDGASYVWYTNGCGTGAPIGTGPSIAVTPSLTTAYFVRAEGACNSTICAGVTINNVCVLPTELIYFNGSYASDIAALSWEVTDNQNLSQFYVERSVDGVTFTRVDSVKAVSEDGMATYNWNDNVASLHTETITYRIVLVFKTGDTKQSAVVAINKPIVLSEGLVVYPNPASHQLTISVNSDKQQTLTYTMISMQGQVLLTGSQVLTRGANSVNVNEVSLLPNGAYILRIQMQDSVTQKKIIIEK